ncbi:hypothetical protein B0T26DRAFT_749977 [Lasiosphaeria miniovina]|uniref:Uncharacterized protein n=1 Tax=Lasiosphaeria miniovina TaxID=1954250 RepID=A0AA40E3D5_9PEZI|nr:uncharacterized protein B0T26DRAFT_749977 [Lasiosphaeria miniovina]KAK0722601.1 hypothetical protein B0T26DRAFT_749977 [Lasiosphaeria miniovina]
MLSAFPVQREFSNMSSLHKALRVSEPTGIQRFSYFISVPLRYGLPLYGTSALLHWLISQSLFLARITAVLHIGLMAVVGIVLIGFRTYDGTMRMVSIDSGAISAACHALEGGWESGYVLPVEWGVFKSRPGVGKCAFTTAPKHEMRDPVPGSFYI